MTTPPQGAGPDVDLILDVALGDPAALEALVRRQVPKILGFMSRTYGILDEELAWEATRRAVARLWETAEQYDESKGAVEAWFLGIAWNQARTLMKERKRDADRRSPAPVEDLSESEIPQAPVRVLAPSPDELEARRRIREVVFKLLTSKQETAVVLDWLATNGHPDYEKIAKETGGTVGALRVALRRAKIRLEDALRAEGLDPNAMVGD